MYPSSLNIRELVSSLVRIPDFNAASSLLEGELTPTRGRKETTDHPPIYPTQAVYPNALEGPKRRVYELVVRRFLATFSKPMITESNAGQHRGQLADVLQLRGSVVVDPGYAAIYTYARSADDEIPKLEQGQTLELEGDPWIVDKETQPPAWISEGKLIQLMEERGGGYEGDPRREHSSRSRYEIVGTVPLESARALGDGNGDVQGVRRDVPRMANLQTVLPLSRATWTRSWRARRDEDEAATISGETRDSHHRRARGTSAEEFAKQTWAGTDEVELPRAVGGPPAGEANARGMGSLNRRRIIDLNQGKRMHAGQGWPCDDLKSALARARSAVAVPGSSGRGRPGRPKEALLGTRGQRAPRLTVKGLAVGSWKPIVNDDAERRSRRARSAPSVKPPVRRARRRTPEPRGAATRAKPGGAKRLGRARRALRTGGSASGARAKKPDSREPSWTRRRTPSSKRWGQRVFVTLEGYLLLWGAVPGGDAR